MLRCTGFRARAHSARHCARALAAIVSFVGLTNAATAADSLVTTKAPRFTQAPSHGRLVRHASDWRCNPQLHLSRLLAQPGRFERFSLRGGGMFLGFTHQRVTGETMQFLHSLAKERLVTDQFAAMASGVKVNNTENRAALHVACRDLTRRKFVVDGKDVAPDVREARKAIKPFVEKIHNGTLRGTTGKRFTDAVVIGIGGSYLGTEFASHALAEHADKNIKLHFLANVDPHAQGRIFNAIDPERTLFIVVSKSYTTAETLLNAAGAYQLMEDKRLDPAKHVLTVTAKGSPGDNPANPVLQAFHMFDFVGGRYSVASAVGGVPLSLELGYDKFTRFLKGAHEMDRHAMTASPEQNLPLTAAMLSVWNNNFLGYGVKGIIPYVQPFSRLAPHVQQLNMESNGKNVDVLGNLVNHRTGPIIFGEPGTNAQHSFFQLAHQGPNGFPIDFIGVMRSAYPDIKVKRRGVTNHQELWSHLTAQPNALAMGLRQEGKKVDGKRRFPGNRPSSMILLKDTSPENVGRLLSFYEAATVYEAFTWGINPFDQYGVENGKTLATQNREVIAAMNKGQPMPPTVDPITKKYLEALMAGELPR